jgi:DNA gyrase subunit A
MDRPPLENIPPGVIEYIEFLETELSKYKSKKEQRPSTAFEDKADLTPVDYKEPVTTYNIVTFSQAGAAKRTYRHEYTRQRRGGIGVFDLETPHNDYPAALANADESQTLIIFTDRAKAYRLPVTKLESQSIRSKGEFLSSKFILEPGEVIVAALAEQATGYIALMSKSGKVRCLRHHLFGEHMKPGTAMYKYDDFGPLAGVCWTRGDSDLFVVTKNGMGIRFNEKIINPQGTQSIKLGDNDEVVAVVAVTDEDGVLVVSADGKGAIRLMSGFAPNKSAGGSGKIVIKSEKVVGALLADPEADIFLISKQSKIIRFHISDVPETAGVVQGVNCMSLRADEVVAITKC